MEIAYQGFKAVTYACGEALLMQKLMMRGRELQENRRRRGKNGAAVAASLSIGSEDLATVDDGVDGDALDMKPFSKFFTKERVVAYGKRSASFLLLVSVSSTRRCN